MNSAPANQHVQSIAKEVMSDLALTITASSTERTIVESAVRLLSWRGIVDTWYYECPAYVLLGSRSCLSISGRDYVPADESVGDTNLVTIDLSPSIGSVWGDYARSMCVEGGKVVESPASLAFCDGLDIERDLHGMMAGFATPNTSFHELYEFANDAIRAAGYENLDFMSNVGHSIEKRREDRTYVARGNDRKLGDVSCFTFEPHIRRKGGRWGFKREDIYFFHEGRCTPL